MARKSTVLLTLIVILVLILAVAKAQNVPLTHYVQGNVSSFNVEVNTIANTNIIACGGCSGGGVGPA